MYQIEVMPKAIKDLAALPKHEAKRVAKTIKNLEQGLVGDIKKLTNFSPEYRLRVGNYRILFELYDGIIIVYRIKHRKKAYLKR